ncbi:MAG: hypothetical protein JWQ90_2530 [Hydrocarboniphaga sp.]|uniref:cytochrome P450 n=1 Tax=Hydrocarboniphaga sp. TaxID=2033016 RepID=UPI00260E0EB1|nr:cytochrome P450 [Hydrocarboniphaga sp.]MDB5970080.1 hypothetical protein [Hydrocarboniphaga sp.]
MSEENSLDRVFAEYDHRDHESVYNPWPRWKKLQSGPALTYSEKYDGFHVASRYNEVCEIARDPQIFSSHLKQTTIPTLVTPPFPPINYDPPDHLFYRVILNPFFTPGKVAAHEAMVRSMAAKYIEPLLASDGFDVPTQLGIPLTREVILKLMGIADCPAEVNKWADDLIFLYEPEKAAANLMGFLAAEVAKRRANPGDDVMSGLVTAEVRGRSLDDSEILRMSLLLLLAGLDTTNSAISGSIWYFVQHPEARKELLAADDTTWRLAMDELVRWVSPAPAQARTARNDTAVGGCPMKEGEMVMLLFGAANRDATEFPDPDSVVLNRFPNRHLGFGMGPHRCLGSHLAKLELQIVLQALLPSLDQFELSDPNAVVWEGASVRGIRALPLTRKKK